MIRNELLKDIDWLNGGAGEMGINNSNFFSIPVFDWCPTTGAFILRACRLGRDEIFQHINKSSSALCSSSLPLLLLSFSRRSSSSWRGRTIDIPSSRSRVNLLVILCNHQKYPLINWLPCSVVSVAAFTLCSSSLLVVFLSPGGSRAFSPLLY